MEIFEKKTSVIETRFVEQWLNMEIECMESHIKRNKLSIDERITKDEFTRTDNDMNQWCEGRICAYNHQKISLESTLEILKKMSHEI